MSAISKLVGKFKTKPGIITLVVTLVIIFGAVGWMMGHTSQPKTSSKDQNNGSSNASNIDPQSSTGGGFGK